MSDLISRTGAIAHFDKVAEELDEKRGDDSWVGNAFKICLLGVVNDLAVFPSAEPQWISVEDSLPEKRQVVLAIGEDSKTWDVGMFKGLSPSHNNHVWWWKKNTVKHVDYWMPKDAIPLPWKE